MLGAPLPVPRIEMMDIDVLPELQVGHHQVRRKRTKVLGALDAARFNCAPLIAVTADGTSCSRSCRFWAVIDDFLDFLLRQRITCISSRNKCRQNTATPTCNDCPSFLPPRVVV